MRLSGLSIRTRLVSLYTLALIAILVPFAAASYLFVRGHLLGSLDTGLEGEATEAVLVMSEGTRLSGSEADLHDSLARLESVEDVWFELRSLSGEQIYYVGMPPALSRVLPPIGQRRGFYSVRPDAEMRARVFEEIIEVGGRPYRFRVVGFAMHVDSTLRRLLLIHIAGLLGALGLAGVSGYLLARRALAPVRLITEKARVLTTEQLKDGIPVVNPGDELGQLATTFNATFARLADSLERMREFTADASHELRNPLTAIRNVAEVGLDRDDAGKRECLESILEEADHMTRILNGLFDLSRAEDGGPTLAFEEVDLAEMAREVVRTLSVVAEERSQDLRVYASAAPVLVRADPLYVRQALMNVVDNAIRHGSAALPIDVRVENIGTNGVISVTDRGPGIAPADQARVFERFYRVDKARSRAMGSSGLGLSIAALGLKANGGTLDLTSVPGRGSTFRIVLPAAGVPR